MDLTYYWYDADDDVYRTIDADDIEPPSSGGTGYGENPYGEAPYGDS
jgi:hypothetical protein